MNPPQFEQRAVTLGDREFLLRPLRAEDVDALEACLDEPPVGATMTDSLLQILECEDPADSLALVAETDGAPVGTASLLFSAEEAWLYCVAVRPDMRNLGLGAAVVSRALELARGRGVKRVCAHVRASNLAARRAYEKAGLASVGADGMRGEQLRYQVELA